MKEETVSILVIFETNSSLVERLRSLLEVLCEIARDEYKCPRFEIFQNTYTPEKFYLMETWQDQKTWEKYISSAEFNSAMEEINKILVYPIQITMLNKLSQA
ncbi:putative quinol monooxygenase [Prolixibacter denitrificans]|uniref:Quinol monooxygenase YgiN n=1 Tax=Prolixibacter denitrificans TaxID=1541063 RepID=A0A2P8C7I8_9BACT|nr:antibiotic biosynthesis monooxygenase [Prolixibacter denitrificans]PSK80887.1 quinol monooxygenase YgiN [Prolixibacter denitrificans]GET22291.1 hypothetical protein JCM18694_25370 [Prolixibacter denitrificans]